MDRFIRLGGGVLMLVGIVGVVRSKKSLLPLAMNDLRGGIHLTAGDPELV